MPFSTNSKKTPSPPNEKIGILGGTFDPIHMGHLAIAQLAWEYFHLNKVYFIPAFNPPHKRNTLSVSVDHRVAMLQIAIKDTVYFDKWDGEILRKGISFTIDTLHALKASHSNSIFYFIIGSDNIVEILTWRRYTSIIKLVTLCVAHRPGYSMNVPEGLKKAEIVSFPSPEWGISSKMIRKYLLNNISCKYLLPKAVLAYIKKHRLYTCL